MSDYQNIIEQSIHSIVDIAYKQGYQDGQKAVENEKYSTHTYWYQKGYEEGKAELSEEEVHNLMSDLIKGEDAPDKEVIEHLKRLANDGDHPRVAKILNDGRMTDAEVKEHLKQLENELLTDDDLRQLIGDGIGRCKEREKEQDKVAQWIEDNADVIKELAKGIENYERTIKSID